MATTPLTYHGLPSGLSDGKSARLQVSTPNGTIREIPLDRRQLHKLLQAAARALEELDRAAEREARGAFVHEGDILTDDVVCGLPRRDVEWSSVTSRTTCPKCIEARS